MSGKRSQRKGRAGEQEFYRELEQYVARYLATVGTCTKESAPAVAEAFMRSNRLGRNYGQPRGGGSDSRAGCPWALEIKRQKRPNLLAAVRQTLAAARPDQEPVVAYRLDGTSHAPEDWHVLVHMDMREFAAYVVERRLC